MINECCNLPEPPVAKDAITSCGVCGEIYQAVEVRDRVGAPQLRWIRIDHVEPDARTIEAPVGRHLPPVEETPAEDFEIQTRIAYLAVPFGKPAPLQMDLGSDVGIIIQSMPEQQDGEVALNVVSFGNLAPEVVAWLLGVASEQLTMKIRVATLTGGEI